MRQPTVPSPEEWSARVGLLDEVSRLRQANARLRERNELVGGWYNHAERRITELRAELREKAA